ncbi:MAG: hypothetical protein J6A53_03300 [Clostridia bacterium]|nr:hypothetical protein [Clostridia bacterium]
MFNDERINAECGKIYSKGILFAVIITLIYTVSRTITLFIQNTFHSFVTYTEAVIMILGIGILLVGTIKFRVGGDERTAFERHSFYKKAAKAFIIAVFGTYILTIPFTTEEMLGGQYHNHLLILLEVLGYLYIFYAFKTKEININYSFIAEKGWHYYSRVFMVIGGLWLGLFVPFLIAASWELVLHNSWAGALTILLAYISSAIGLSIEYFFVSLVEKTSYDSMGNGRFALGTKIAMLVGLIVEFTIAVFQGLYVYYATENIQEIPNIKNFGTVVAFFYQNIKRLEFLSIVLVGLVVCHIMSQIKKGGFIYKVCRVKMFLLALAALEATLSPVWYRALSEEAIRYLANYVDPYLSLISFAITLTMWILFISSVIKELGVSRVLWTIPVLYTVAELANIFFVSQSMLRVGSFSTLGAEMLCLIIMVIVLWRYNGFATTKDE